MWNNKFLLDLFKLGFFLAGSTILTRGAIVGMILGSISFGVAITALGALICRSLERTKEYQKQNKIAHSKILPAPISNYVTRAYYVPQPYNLPVGVTQQY